MRYVTCSFAPSAEYARPATLRVSYLRYGHKRREFADSAGQLMQQQAGNGRLEMNRKKRPRSFVKRNGQAALRCLTSKPIPYSASCCAHWALRTWWRSGARCRSDTTSAWRNPARQTGGVSRAGLPRAPEGWVLSAKRHQTLPRACGASSRSTSRMPRPWSRTTGLPPIASSQNHLRGRILGFHIRNAGRAKRTRPGRSHLCDGHDLWKAQILPPEALRAGYWTTPQAIRSPASPDGWLW